MKSGHVAREAWRAGVVDTLNGGVTHHHNHHVSLDTDSRERAEKATPRGIGENISLAKRKLFDVFHTLVGTHPFMNEGLKRVDGINDQRLVLVRLAVDGSQCVQGTVVAVHAGQGLDLDTAR